MESPVPMFLFRILAILFRVLAPISVPLYFLFLAVTNLLGAAFYIVVEASVARIARRPITLSSVQMALLVVPVLVAAPFATAVHLLIWFAYFLGRAMCWLGTWQTGIRFRTGAFFAGLLWSVSALWVTTTCMNAAVGLGWIGQPLEGKQAFVHHLTRGKTLAEMSPEMQERRRQLILEIDQYKEQVEPQWEKLKTILEDDETSFRWLAERRLLVAKKLASLPWFFLPGELSSDGLDHSDLMLGPLFFAWMLLICWPGMLRLLRFDGLRCTVFVFRAALVVGAIAWLATWEPITSYADFWPGTEQSMGLLGSLMAPATWRGVGLTDWIRPQWYLFNTGLWLALIGIVIFVWWLAWRVSPFLGWPRYYVAFLASRLLQRKRIAFFSVGAVTLCVAMMIIVISVMGGFLDTIRSRAHGLLGDLVMDGGLQGFPYYQEFIDKIGRLKDKDTGEPLVVQATPLIHSYGILQFPRTKMTKAIRIWGVRLDEYVRVNKFGDNLFYNNRFGGTVLGRQKKPFYGFNEAGQPVLPGDMDEHYKQYVQDLSPEKQAEERQRFAREPGFLYPGPGVFAMDEDVDAKPRFAGPERPGVIIGRDIIARRMASGEYHRKRDYPRGEACLITVLPLTRGGDVSAEPPPKPAFRYVDDSRTGIHEIDSMNVYVDFEELQGLLSMGALERAEGGGMAGARCTQIQIKLVDSVANDRNQLYKAKQLIEEMWDEFRLAEGDIQIDYEESRMMAQVGVATWEEMQKSFISAIEKEKFLVLIMFGVISVVAVFLILCIFYMIVQEKTRDIGIIKSVGGSAEGVAAVFLVYGGAIGLVGCVLGSLLGITFVEHINDVQEWLARLNPDWRVWSPETYSFDKIPDVWKWSEVIWISILAVIASVAGAAFPAIRASRTWPVESLRYE